MFISGCSPSLHLKGQKFLEFVLGKYTTPPDSADIIKKIGKQVPPSRNANTKASITLIGIFEEHLKNFCKDGCKDGAVFPDHITFWGHFEYGKFILFNS